MNKIKFALFDNCIFCGNKLPPTHERQGDGEHVFPKNIFGFWKSRDICEGCIKYFGTDIDKLPDRNFEIQKAKIELKIEKNKYVEGTEFEGIDSFNSKKVDFILKDDKPRIKFIKTDDFFQFREDKLDTLGLEWIKKDRIKYLSEEEIDIELNNLKKEYNKAEYGTTIYNDKLKVYIRKAQAKVLKVKEGKSKSLNKLSGKIAYIFLSYFLNKSDFEKILDLKILKNYIMNGSDIPEFTIYRCEYFKNEKYYKHHFVKIDIYDGIIFVYVVYFGYISYVLNIRTNGVLTTQYPNLKNELKDVESIVFALEFPENRKMIIERKLKNEEGYILSEVEL